MKTYYIIPAKSILIQMIDGVFHVQPEFTVWGTFAEGEKGRAMIYRNNKKEAQQVAKEYGMVVATKIYTEEEVSEIREENYKA
jgi:hypothetical protein